MKRIVSLVLALSMVLSMFTFSFAGLKDVEGTEYEAAVEALVELGIVAGYPDGTFLPNKVVTRAELAKLLVTAYGLDEAAEASKGPTAFADVNADAELAWATGYINVAADYGFINGYPDGTFNGKATVTYAEAVTMCLRVLGYAREIEAKGTWPTNYMAKAHDLKMLKDISYGSYNDGAKRGDTALLIWNMLRTNMWTVNSESEGDGLHSTANTPMIKVKFGDYNYVEELVVTDIVLDDRKVSVELTDEDEESVVWELREGTDFLKLFGRTVSVLYNKEDEEIVSITPDSEDTIAEGPYYKMVEDGYTLAEESGEFYAWGMDEDDTDFTVSVIEKRKVAEYTTYFNSAATGIVEEVKEAKSGKVTVKFEEGSLTFEEPDEVIVLVDGEWAYPQDIEKGDVLTQLAESLFIVNRKTVKGDFESLTIEEDAEDYRVFIEVDGEEYNVLTALTEAVVEVDEDGDFVATTPFDDIYFDDESKFYDEECTLYMTHLNEIIKVEFNEIEDKEEKGNFYVVTNLSAIWEDPNESGVTEYVKLNGERKEIKSTSQAIENCAAADVVFVKFDKQDRITELSVVPESGELDKYTFEMVSGEITEDDYLGTHKVLGSTVVYTILPVEDEDEAIEYYEVEITKGTAELEGIKGALVAYETEDSLERARYVFVWEEAKNTEKSFGLVNGFSVRKGISYIKIDDETYELNTEDSVEAEYGDLVAFTEDAKNGVTVVKAYSVDEIGNGAKVLPTSGDFDPRFVETTAGIIDLKSKEKAYEDHKVFFVEIGLNADEDYEFTSWEEIEYSEIRFKEDDIIAETKETDSFKAVIIIRGYED